MTRICVVGAGRWGRNHVRTLAELGALGGVVDTNPEALAEISAAHPEAECLADLETAARADFDGFVVATPAQTHAQVASFLIDSGHHVLVEKPLALTTGDARRLVALAKKRGRHLMVGHLLLFHPAVRTMKRWIDEGRIGRLQYLYSNRLNLGTVRTEENILWSFAPHDISLFQHFIGERPTEVLSRGGAFLQPEIHDSTMTLLRYPGNVVGHIFVSWLHPFKEHRLVLSGSGGMLSYEDSSEEKQLVYYEKGIDWVQGKPVKRDSGTEIVPYDPESPLTAELKAFIEQLSSDGPPPLAGGTSGVEVLEILEQASGSLQVEPEPEPEPAPSRIHPSARLGPGARVHESAYVDADCVVGPNTKIWHFSHLQQSVRIGAGCSVGQNVNIGDQVVIGDHVKIQNNVSVYQGVRLDDYVFCGPSCVFTNVRDPRSKYPQRGAEHYLPTHVKEGASIGANATIVCGSTIGRHAFVAAGATVTRDVPDYALMVGVPARRTGWICECGERLPGDLDCPRCGRRYELSERDQEPWLLPVSTS